MGDYREAGNKQDFAHFDLVFATDLVRKKEQCEQVAKWCASVGLPVLLVYVPRWVWLTETLFKAFVEAGLQRIRLPKLEAMFQRVEAYFFSSDSIGSQEVPSWLGQVA